MRALTIILGSLLVTLISTQVSAAPMCQHAPITRGPASNYTCKIVTGYGTATGHGDSKLKAKEEARLNCGMGLINEYSARRQDIPEQAIDDLALACVNLECQ